MWHEWMTQAAATIYKCSVDDVKKGREWVMVDDPQQRFTTGIAVLGRECREWPEGATND